MRAFIDQLEQKQSLSREQSRACLSEILEGTVSDDDTIELLSALTEKQENPDEILGFIDALKAASVPIPYASETPLIDICGTGGSGKDRFNISTCVAFVLAAGGLSVAKHGNYGSQRPNGSFNFLEEMNLTFNYSPDEVVTLLEKSNLCFLLARLFHPSMRFVAKARKRVGKRTIFNLIGPFCNPLPIQYQLIGLSSKATLPHLIEVAQQLPMKRVLFCIGGDERDEISLSGSSTLVTVEGSSVKEESFDFSSIDSSVNPDYYCGESQENATIFTHILMDQHWEHPIVKHIAINAAAGFKLAAKVATIQEGYEAAISLFETGAVTAKINDYKKACSEITR